MADLKSNAVLNEWIGRFAAASRGNLCKGRELISFRRTSAEYFTGLRLKKKYELDRDDVVDWLQRCPTVYFTDYTDAYDDTADRIADSNPLQRLSPFFLDIAKNTGLTMAMFELSFKHLDPAVKSELAAGFHPDTHVPMDMFTEGALRTLGLEVPEDDFFSYRSFISLCGELRRMLVEKGVFARDLSAVHEFLLFVYTDSR